MDPSDFPSSTPKVSVVLPVYNGEKYLHEAIASILAQSFRDFELIILNDGSTDRSDEIISSFSDTRIVSIRNPHNKGLVETLNLGIQAARGTYLARMDADDISLPHRLQVQVSYLDQHPKVGVIGGGYILIDANGSPISSPKYWTEYPLATMWMLLICNPLCHPSTILRTDLLRKIGGYQAGYAEEYRLWTDLAEYTQLCSIHDTLLYYRATPAERYSIDHFQEQVQATIQIRQMAAERLFNRTMETRISVVIQGDRSVPDSDLWAAYLFLVESLQTVSRKPTSSPAEFDELNDWARQYLLQLISRMSARFIVRKVLPSPGFFSRAQILDHLFCRFKARKSIH